MFDIYYNARSDGRGDARADKVRYALALTMEASHVTDLYDRVVQTYRTHLKPIVPIIDVPVPSLQTNPRE